MAHWQLKLAAFAAVVVLGLTAAWYAFHLPAGGTAPAAAETSVDTPRSGLPDRPAEPAFEVVRPALPEEVDDDPDGPWVITGRLRFGLLQGFSLHPGGRDICVQSLDFATAGSKTWTRDVRTDPYGGFRYEIHRTEKDPALHGWHVYVRDLPAATSPLDSAAVALPRPALVDVPGLLRPRIRGRFINLGEVHVDFASGEPLGLLTGRLVHASGASLPGLSFEVSGLRDDKDVVSRQGETGPDGRFTIPVSGTRLDGCVWWLDEPMWERATAMPAPRVKGAVADFGDVLLDGALVDVLVSAPGAGESSPPFSATRDAFNRRNHCVKLALNAQGSSRSVVLPVRGAPVRLLLPDGRYEYSAEITAPDFYAADITGSLAARVGMREELALNFQPERTVPLTLLDPSGAPLRADIAWALRKARPGELDAAGNIMPAARTPSIDAYSASSWRNRGAIMFISNGEKDGALLRNWEGAGARCVPVKPGCITEVAAGDEHYKPVHGFVSAKDRELVLQFTQNSMAGRLEIVLPALPPGVSDTSWAGYVVVEYARDDEARRAIDGGPVELFAGRTGLHVVPSAQKAGPAKVRLDGGWTGGYPKGRLTEPLDIEIPESGTLRVELPAIAPPPWGANARHIVARVRCGGVPATVFGRFRYGHTLDDRRFTDAQTLYMQGGHSSWYEGEPETAIPDAMVFDSGEVPVNFDRSAQGKAVMGIEVPPRLSITVVLGGKALGSFEASVGSDGTGRFGSSSETASGTLNLWCTPGRADLRVEVPGRREVWLGVVDVPSDGCLPVNVKIDVIDDTGGFTVEFRRPPGATARTGALWRVHTVVEGKPSDASRHVRWGSTERLPAGKYLLKPDDWRTGAAPFEVEITGDCNVTLPDAVNADIATVMLKLPASELRAYTGCDFGYYIHDGGGDKERLVRIAAGQVEVPWGIEERLGADAVHLSGLPLGKRVLLRGSCRWHEDGRQRVLLMQPVEITLRAENVIEAQWSRGIELGKGWPDERPGVVSDFAGHLLPFAIDNCVRPGNHELAVFLDGKEAFRHTVTVPDKAEPFDVPADLLRKVEEARERAKPQDE